MARIGIFLIIVVVVQIGGVLSEVPCDYYVDITDGYRSGKNITKDGVTYTENDYFDLEGSIKGCICKVKMCVRKCCSENETMNMTSRSCVRSSTGNGQFTNFSVHSIINVPENRICKEFQLKVIIDKDFSIVNGVLIWEENTFASDDYCLNKQDDQFLAIACLQEETAIQGIVLCLGMIISMPFLLVTFIVYLLLPDRNLHRKALMAYVLNLLGAYLCLVIIQLNYNEVSNVSCHLLGYFIILFFLGSFFWMNVMCVDMWLAFSGMKTFLTKKSAERKRFIIYCIYAFNLPLLLVLVVFLLNTYSDKNSIYHPKIAENKCFLGDGLPMFFYFYLPISILIAINIGLFILTSIRIRKIKRETSMLKQSDSKRHTYEDDKQKFNLYMKLMFAMGVNWIMEIISWAVDLLVKNTPPFVWYLTDFTNAMYGVLIFFIFVCKKKTWISLKKRYYVFIGKPHLAHSMTSSTRGTRSSNYSTTETAVSTDFRLSDLKNGKNADESALNRT